VGIAPDPEIVRFGPEVGDRVSTPFDETYTIYDVTVEGKVRDDKEVREDVNRVLKEELEGLNFEDVPLPVGIPFPLQIP
jgi:hypothetical protein